MQKDPLVCVLYQSYYTIMQVFFQALPSWLSDMVRYQRAVACWQQASELAQAIWQNEMAKPYMERRPLGGPVKYRPKSPRQQRRQGCTKPQHLKDQGTHASMDGDVLRHT